MYTKYTITGKKIKKIYFTDLRLKIKSVACSLSNNMKDITCTTIAKKSDFSAVL